MIHWMKVKFVRTLVFLSFRKSKIVRKSDMAKMQKVKTNPGPSAM